MNVIYTMKQISIGLVKNVLPHEQLKNVHLICLRYLPIYYTVNLELCKR